MKKFKTKDEMRLERMRQNSAAWRASESGSQASATWRVDDLGLNSLPPLRSLRPQPQLTPTSVVPPRARRSSHHPGTEMGFQDA